MPVIYIDVLFGVNLIIDFMLFYVSARLAGRRLRPLRLIFACLAGGIYSVLIFFPRLGILQSAAAKTLVSSLLVCTAFRLKNFKDFLFMLGVFYGVNFVFAGGIAAIMYFTDFGAKTDALLSNGSLYINLPFFKLLIIAALITIFLHFGIRALRKALKMHGIICRLSVSENKKTATLYGIIDTGNSLFSHGMPVCVLQYSSVAQLLPKNISDAIELGDIAGAISSADINWAKKLKLIPYSAIGTKNGLLLGFVPEKVSLEISDRIYYPHCIIALYPGKLKHSAIINSDIICGKDEYYGHCGIAAKKGNGNS